MDAFHSAGPKMLPGRNTLFSGNPANNYLEKNEGVTKEYYFTLLITLGKKH